MKPLESATISAGMFDARHARLHADREHHQVVRVGVAVIALGVHAVQDQVARPCPAAILATLDLMKFTVGIRLHLLVEVLEAVDGADVDVIDGGLAFVAEGFAHVLGLLQRGHAADARAVAQMVLVARTGALDEGDVLRFLAVGRAQDLAAGRAMRIGQALELDAGDHVGEAVVAVRLNLAAS